MAITRFPEELMNQSREARYRYFNDLIVMHPRLVEAHDAIWNALHDPDPPALINLFGPSGIGKTTLLSWIKQELLEEALPSLLVDPGRIPFVALDAIPAIRVTYDWNDFIIRVLKLLNEPLIDEKLDLRFDMDVERQPVRSFVASDRIAPQLIRAFEHSLYHRKVSTLIVDDASYLEVMHLKERLVAHFREMKAILQKTQTTCLFVGTYDLFDLLMKINVAGWEGIDVHFPCYQLDSNPDNSEFHNTLLTFQRHLPVAVEPDFVQHGEYLYTGSTGCIGLLKGWLNRSLAVALENDDQTITLQHLERYKWSSAKLQQFRNESKGGGTALTKGHSPQGRDSENPDLQAGKKSGRSVRRIGQRNPVRDRVGE